MIPLDDSNVFGEPATTLPIDIIATILDITIIGWSNVIKRKEVKTTPPGESRFNHISITFWSNLININCLVGVLFLHDSLENHITGCLCRAMRQEKKLRPGLKIRIESEVGTFSTPESIEPEGRIDIKIFYNWIDTEYFGIECKRVSSTNPDRDLATKYVKNGVLRFVNGIYGAGHDWGAMLGFVIDQKIDDNITLVKERINKYKQDVCLEKDWTVEKNFGSISNLYRTSHRQQSHNSLINILHLFLEIS